MLKTISARFITFPFWIFRDPIIDCEPRCDVFCRIYSEIRSRIGWFLLTRWAARVILLGLRTFCNLGWRLDFGLVSTLIEVRILSLDKTGKFSLLNFCLTSVASDLSSYLFGHRTPWISISHQNPSQGENRMILATSSPVGFISAVLWAVFLSDFFSRLSVTRD